MNEDKTGRYVRSMSKKSGLPYELCKEYIDRKTWLGMFGETNLSMLFSPKIEEIPFQYGEELFTPIQSVDVECTITKTDLGSAYPGIYEISDCKILSKLNENFELSINRILSFEGALIGYFVEGESIVVRGLLEKVSSERTKQPFAQILLGTNECSGNEFILQKADYEKFDIIRKNSP